MGLQPFFFGVIFSIPAVLVCLKLFGGRFLVITNRYFAGVLYGFWLWAIIVALLYVEMRFDLLGLAAGEEGFSFVALFVSSVRGFLTGGLAAALIYTKVLRK